MRLGTIYICVSDMQKSLSFYRTPLQREPARRNADRWCFNIKDSDGNAPGIAGRYE